MIHRMKSLATRWEFVLRSRRGMANREVSPMLAVALGVAVLMLIGGGFFLMQKKQQEESTKRTTSKEGAKKFFSNPENLRRAREAAGTSSGQ